MNSAPLSLSALNRVPSSAENTGSASADPIHVAFVADANYGPYAGIAISAVIGTNRLFNLHFHLFSDRMRRCDVERARRMVSRSSAQLSVYEIGDRLNGQPSPGKLVHFTRAANGRLLLPEFLPDDVHWIIYMDCDVICVGDLSDLWQRRKDISVVGAVRDVWLDRDTGYKKQIGISDRDAYFNSGVLLINVKNWRTVCATERLLSFIASRSGARFPDQDAINVVLRNDIVELARKWNTLVTSPDQSEIDDQMRAACIIHYCAGFKPWHLGYGLVMRTAASEFRRAKAASPWRWILPDLQFSRLHRKWSKIIARGRLHD